MTAERFKEDSPEAADLIKKSTYVDNQIDSHASLNDAVHVTGKAEEVLKKGGFAVKCWQLSGEEKTHVSFVSKANSEKSSQQTSKSLSMLKDPWSWIESCNRLSAV